MALDKDKGESQGGVRNCEKLHMMKTGSCHFFIWLQMGCVKRKSVFEHAQNVWIYIIMYMRKVSFGHLLFIETFYNIQWFRLRAVKALIRLRGCAVWSRPSLSSYARRHVFAYTYLGMLKQTSQSHTLCEGHLQEMLVFVSLMQSSKSIWTSDSTKKK